MATRFHDIGSASALPLNLIAQAIPKLTRHELESLTERLIDRLDEIDPDPEAEDGDEDHCPAGDDGCGGYWYWGRLHWGSGWEDEGI